MFIITLYIYVCPYHGIKLKVYMSPHNLITFVQKQIYHLPAVYEKDFSQLEFCFKHFTILFDLE